MKSSRTFQFGLFPRTNIPDYIDSIEDYLDIIEKLEYTDTIESVLCAHLLISQSKINIDHSPEEIDYIIERK